MHTFPLLLRRVLLSLLLVGGLITAAAAQPFEHDQIIEKKFKARPGQVLTLNADFGSVEVQGGRGHEVFVRVIKGANDVSRRQAEAWFDRYEIDMRETGQGVDIRGRYDRPSRWRGSRMQVRYEITVPERYNVRLQTAGGSLSVAGVAGKAQLETAGGSVRLADVGGPVEVETSGGSITAERVGDYAQLHTSGGSISVRAAGGPVNARTSGGSITIQAADGDVLAHTSGGSIRLTEIAGSVDAHTSGGSIEAEIVRQPQRPVTLDTSGGSVRLALDGDVHADLDARASGGSVRTDLAVAVRGEAKRDRLAGQINGGGPLITLRSSGGGIHIREH